MSAAGNVIAYNGGDGVSALFGAGNSVRGNAIFANGSLGIVSDINGVLSTYAEERGLDLLSGIPVLTSAIVDSQDVLVAGALTGVPFTTYDLDFFANDTFDPSGFGEGQRVLESIAVVTDATGAASFQVRLESAVARRSVAHGDGDRSRREHLAILPGRSCRRRRAARRCGPAHGAWLRRDGERRRGRRGRDQDRRAAGRRRSTTRRSTAPPWPAPITRELSARSPSVTAKQARP